MQAYVSIKLDDTKLNQAYIQPFSNENDEIQNELNDLKNQVERNIENQASEISELKEWVEL